MKLSDLATVIRSKNAGPFELTFDVLFATKDDFEVVVRSEILSARSFADLFRIPESDVLSIVEFEAGTRYQSDHQACPCVWFIWRNRCLRGPAACAAVEP